METKPKVKKDIPMAGKMPVCGTCTYKISTEWLMLSGVAREQVKEFMEFLYWKRNK